MFLNFFVVLIFFLFFNFFCSDWRHNFLFVTEILFCNAFQPKILLFRQKFLNLTKKKLIDLNDQLLRLAVKVLKRARIIIKIRSTNCDNVSLKSLSLILNNKDFEKKLDDV